MKCAACGYEYEYHWRDYDEHFDKVVDKGDVAFILVKGTFIAREEFGSWEERGIVACPKCGTLKLVD